MNEQGDHQMETYFNNPSGSNNGGMFCEDERTGPKMQSAFRKIDAIHNHSFKVTGGNYTKQEYERTCAIRLARTLFFQVYDLLISMTDTTISLRSIILIRVMCPSCRTTPLSTTASTTAVFPHM